MRLAQMIRLWCAANNVDQKTLAADWGCGESTVTRFLASEQMPNGLTMARVIGWLLSDKTT